MRELERELRDRQVLSEGARVTEHHLETLLRMTGALGRWQANPAEWRAFVAVNRWMPAWRYSSNLACEPDARSFLEKVDRVLRRIEANI